LLPRKIQESRVGLTRHSKEGLTGVLFYLTPQ